MKRFLSLMLCAIFALALLTSCAQPTQPLTAAELLDLGKKYLLELKYEQALVQFLAVIEIEPMNPCGYTGAAEAYVRLGQTDKAIEVLELGLVALVNHRDLTTMITEIQSAFTNEAAQDGLATQDGLYYSSLSEQEKQMLSRLEVALRASDYDTAHNIQRSDEFHALTPDEGSFWYYPDEETIVHVYRGQREGYLSYEMELYLGKDGEGSYRLGKYGGRILNESNDYILYETTYSGGKANGPFACYNYHNVDSGETEFYIAKGNLNNGEAYGPVYNEVAGHIYEQYDYPPGWLNWWPDWRER